MARQCPQCQTVYGDSIEVCPADQTPLEAFDPNEDPYLGVTIDGRFRLDDLLGAGGMGRVYRGTQLSVDREVAVKLLRGEAVPDRLMKERFLREARVISGFSHPNIIRLIDFGNDADHGFPYLVMELAGGISLADLIRAGRLHPRLAVEIARQVCSGLLEAHDANIVHRDLKPDNLHLIANSDGSFLVKILDFGIAFPQDASKNLTATGMMCGTATYVSPEQARSSKVDGQSDLYSLGVILFEMLTGVLPFRGESGFEIIVKQVQEPPPDLRQFLPPNAVPDPLVDLTYELLEKNPRDRPAGASAVRDRLDAIADRLDEELEIAAEREGIQRFERWLLPSVPEEAPIHESDTLADESEDPRGGEDPSLSRMATEPADEGDGAPSTPEPPFEGTEPLYERSDGEHLPPGADRPPGSEESAGTEPSGADPVSSDAGIPKRDADETGGRLGLAILAASALLGLLVAGYAAVDWRGEGAEGSRPRASSPAPDGTDAPGGTESRAELEPVAAPLNDLAGRCVLVGEPSVDFRTVYFYPEIGEMLLREGARIRWSRLRVAGRRGDRIAFDYAHAGSESPPAELEGRGWVRKSADKRIFELENAERFVCRREVYPAYYTDLALEGRWRSKSGERRLSFPDAGQRFSIRPTSTASAADGADTGDRAKSYSYRLLDGEPRQGDRTLAVRRDGGSAGWSTWRLEGDPERGRLVLRRGASEAAPTTTYRRVDDGPDRGTDSDPDPPGRAPSSAKAATRSNPPDPRADESTESTSDSEESATKKVWRRRHRRILEQCRSGYEEIQANSRQHQKLIEQGKHDEARAFTETLREENEKASEKMRKAGERFSALVQEMATAGVPASKIQKMSAQFSAACQGK